MTDTEQIIWANAYTSASMQLDYQLDLKEHIPLSEKFANHVLEKVRAKAKEE